MSNCQLYKYNIDEIELITENEAYFVENFDIAQLDKKYVHWLNFHSTKERDLLDLFWKKQGFHKLAFDDIYTNKQRPKLEEFGDYLFFSIQSALPGGSENSLIKKEQLSFVLGKNYLISIQERSSDHFPEVRERLMKKLGKMRERQADMLLFRMLGAIIDNYFEVMDDMVELITRLETRIISHPNQHTLKLIEVQKLKLIELRRIIIPMKDIIVQLEKSDSPEIAAENSHYFSDLKDNCLTLLDEIDSNKQVLEGLTNIYYAAQGQRMNEIIKVLTIVSTIFIPLTFIVGVYGMNFDVMPELRWTNGYLLVWVVMVLIAIGLLYFFYRKGWMKRN